MSAIGLTNDRRSSRLSLGRDRRYSELRSIERRDRTSERGLVERGTECFRSIFRPFDRAGPAEGNSSTDGATLGFSARHGSRDAAGVPAVPEPGLRGDIRLSTKLISPVLIAAISSTSFTTGIGCPSHAGSPTSRQSGPTGTIPSISPESGGSASFSPSRRPTWSSPSAKARPSSSEPTRSVNTSASIPAHLWLQYEGMNPSGSFKDNGMTAAFTHARMVSARRVACASTGNTSAALAVYCSATDLGFRAIIFIGSGKIAYGKLAQALDHGALTIQIVGDFDDAMQRVRQVADRLGIYLMNSVNPFRLEGQKTIIYRVLEGLRWEVPDWIVVPGGNLGNSSAFGKALIELHYLGLISRVPRLAVINAAGARTLEELVGQSRTTVAERAARDGQGRATYYGELDPEQRQGLDDRVGDRDQPAGQSEEVPAGARILPGSGHDGQRPGDHGCEGSGRSGGHGVRAGQRGQRGGRQASCARRE